MSRPPWWKERPRKKAIQAALKLFTPSVSKQEARAETIDPFLKRRVDKKEKRQQTL